MGSRQQGPINTDTKEQGIFRHFGIRCIVSGNKKHETSRGAGVVLSHFGIKDTTF